MIFFWCREKETGSAFADPAQSVKKLVFDRLAEAKGAAKTSNPHSSAYRWYGRVRIVM